MCEVEQPTFRHYLALMTNENDPLSVVGDPVAHAGGGGGDWRLSHVRCRQVRSPGASAERSSVST